jgi:P-type Ca2+ transporter type 2C
MEDEEEDVMQRPPRKLQEPLFSRQMVILGLVQGLGVLAVVFTVYWLALSRGLGAGEARLLSFGILVLGNLGLIFTNRSWSHSILAMLRVHNRALWWVTGGTLLSLGLVFYVPFLNKLFGFAPPQPWQIGLILVAALVSLSISEIVKLLMFHNKPLRKSPEILPQLEQG